jgi:hypothetical protein
MVHVAPCVGNVTELAFAVDVALTPSTQANGVRRALCGQRYGASIRR